MKKFLVVVIGFLIFASSVHATEPNPNSLVEMAVTEAFKDTPVMIGVARCETNFRQFSADGSVLFDRSGTYIGVFQIDEKLHFMAAWEKNMNLYTLEGNIAYARVLYEQNGTKPWSGCVPKKTAGAPRATSASSSQPSSVPSAATPQLTKILRIGMSGSEVKLLQQKLNSLGFTLATSGPGSPGNETTLFGEATKLALQKYQCERKITCEGGESTTGYGKLGPLTKQKLNLE